MRSAWLHLKNFFSHVIEGLRQFRQLRRPQFVHTIETFSKRDLYLALTAAILLVASGGFLIVQLFTSHGPYGGELTEGLLGEPQFINPVYSSSNSTDSDLTRIVFAQLLAYDSAGNLSPDLADSLPEISADKKTFTLKLKANLKWQDGAALSADDVIFTIQTIQNPEYESPLRPNWIRVKVQKLDDATVQFKLGEVSNSFVNNFALGIIPKHLWENLSPPKTPAAPIRTCGPWAPGRSASIRSKKPRTA